MKLRSVKHIGGHDESNKFCHFFMVTKYVHLKILAVSFGMKKPQSVASSQSVIFNQFRHISIEEIPDYDSCEDKDLDSYHDDEVTNYKR